MIGAGIFALLGEAGAIAGSAVYISFILGGMIALLSGYSLGRLGARYPSAGGIVEYLVQSFGVGLVSGSMSIVLYFAAVVSLSLIAKTFGNYAAILLQLSAAEGWHHVFSVGIVVLFTLINLGGARDVAVWERLTVAIKFIVLTALAITGILFLRPALLSPATYPPVNDVLFSLAITFFAYEGFRVITNTAEDMPDAKAMVPRAIITSIVLVMLLYVIVALAVFGHLTSEEVIESKEYALAQAALPVFGQVGFTIVAITALISTASSINANLYAVTNVTYQLAKTGELPAAFGHRIAHSREGLVISAIFVIALTLFFDLSAIAAIGSISILFVHGVTHLGHIVLRRETGARLSIVLAAAFSSFAAMFLAITYIAKANPSVIWILASLLGAGVLAEIVLQRVFGRFVRSRI